jgi:hypothetical protein
MSNTREKLELALSAIDAAIGELCDIDGMESYCEQLGMLSAEIDCELEELVCLEESAE